MRGLVLLAVLSLACATAPRPELRDLRVCVQRAQIQCGPELLACQLHVERQCMLGRGWAWVPRTGYVALAETDDVRRGREIEAHRKGRADGDR